MTTLATRCTACGTAFRVVQDQLKVANGWVRCGRCEHVFDASGVLFTPEGAAATPADAADPPPGAIVAAPSASPVDAPSSPAAERSDPMADGPAAPAVVVAAVDSEAVDSETRPASDEASPARSATEPSTPAAIAPPTASQPLAPAVVDIGIGSVALPPPAPAHRPSDDVGVANADAADDGPPDFVDARFNEELLAGLPGLRDPADGDAPLEQGAAVAVAAAGVATPPETDRPMAGSPPLSTADAPAAAFALEPARSASMPADDALAPTFLHQARRARSRRDQRWMRIALGTSAVLLGLALAWQSAILWRDVLAARWPAAAPWLVSACAPVGCGIHPLRRIDDLSVDSTTLAPTAPDSPALRLAVVLVNRGDLPLAAPSVELSLTDTAGELVARKVLHPADFHADGGALKPSATVRWQAVLNVAERAPDQHVAGYTVELFYP